MLEKVGKKTNRALTRGGLFTSNLLPRRKRLWACRERPCCFSSGRGFPTAAVSLSDCKVLPYIMASPCGPRKDQILQKAENPVKSGLCKSPGQPVCFCPLPVCGWLMLELIACSSSHSNQSRPPPPSAFPLSSLLSPRAVHPIPSLPLIDVVLLLGGPEMQAC